MNFGPGHESEGNVGVEIGHILFIDIVGYSKLSSNEQRRQLEVLNAVVRKTDQFQSAHAADKLIRLPTGDGMALAFFTSPDAPARCAAAVSRELKNSPDIKVRMGIHSGPVDVVHDVSDRPNITGSGINMAQRVMDGADAGHILLSKRAADDLAQYDEWKTQLHDLGEMEVKHGVRVAVVNFYNDEIGNAAKPEKLRLAEESQQAKAKKAARRKLWLAIAAVLVACFGILSFWGVKKFRSGSHTSAIPEQSIAVLPFENLSEDKANAFFATGIQDEILTRLAKISALKVISRSSTKRYESKPANLRQIGIELGVAAVLEGTVQKVGNTLRVNVQLIKAATDVHLWAETYDRELVDVLSLESEIASRIAASLKATLSPDEEKRVNAVATTNPDAYEAYLQGRELLRFASTASYDEELIRNQRQLYEKALALDSHFALVHAALSENYAFDFQNYGASSEKRIKARSEAEEALRLEPDLAEGHVALGSYHYRVSKEYEAAAREYAIALKALPNDVELLWSMAMMERRLNHWRGHLEGLQRCLSLNPRDLFTLSQLGDSYVAVHNYAAAEETRRHQVELAKTVSADETVAARGQLCDVQWIRTGSTAPWHALYNELPKDSSTVARGSVLLAIGYVERNADQFLQGYSMINRSEEGLDFDVMHAFLAKGDTKKANDIIQSWIERNEQLVRANPGEARYHTWLGLWYASAGRQDEAIREGRRATQLVPEAKDASDGPMMTTNLAVIYAKVEKPELALDLIEHLLSIPCDGDALQHTRELQVAWRWDPLRKEPRFQKLIKGPTPKIVYN